MESSPHPGQQLPSGTVTFLFTDVEGSTALWERAPEAMRTALARHDALLRAAIAGHDGHIVKTAGDGFHAVFARAPDALAAALDAQRRLHAEPWGVIESLRVRMAVHTGAAEERDGDYFGPPLNRAGRLLSAGHGGQVLLSQVTYDLIRDDQPAGARVIDLGEHRLKDLSRSEHVYQVTQSGLASDFPPLCSLDALPNNLPRQLTSFVGREQEMAEVRRLLAATSLLTLVGTGGAGKTRMALQVAADLVDAYRDGAWLVELAPLADPSLVAQAVGSALGLQEQAGRPALVTLQEYLRSRALLLVLDNCEHLVSACALLADTLLHACPDLKILATGREALGIAGETTWRVPSLALPDGNAVAAGEVDIASALSHYEAVRLFIDRALAVVPTFTVTNQNAPAVAQICHRLDGVPLAIELAAARIRVLAPEQIATRLDDRFRLLTGGSRAALPRQQTLRALVDWSYDLLSEAERTLLRRLSVFSGGWTLEAAEAVCAGKGIAASEILDLLTQLVDKSIVIAEVGGEATRYRLLETLRQYGAEKLVESGEAARMERANRDWFLDFAERAVIDFWGEGLATWIRLLDADHDNVRSALALTLAEQDERSVERGLRLAAALGPFCWVRNHLAEGRRGLERALGADPSANRPPDAGASLPTPTGLLRHFMGAHPRVAALNMLSSIEDVYPDFKAAYEHATEARALAERVGDPVGLANALILQGIVLKDQGAYEDSVVPFEESLRLLRSIGHRWSAWRALSNLGEANIFLGNFARAQALVEEAQPIASSIGLNYGVAHGYRFLGLIAYASNDRERATALTEKALDLYRALGTTRGPDTALNQLGQIVLARGEHLGAAARFRESLRLWQSGGEPSRRNIASSLEGLASVAIATHAGSSPAPLIRAARLLGAAAATRAASETPLTPLEWPTVELAEAAARGRLGKKAYDAAWAEGRSMTLEQAVAYAFAASGPAAEA